MAVTLIDVRRLIKSYKHPGRSELAPKPII